MKTLQLNSLRRMPRNLPSKLLLQVYWSPQLQVRVYRAPQYLQYHKEKWMKTMMTQFNQHSLTDLMICRHRPCVGAEPEAQLFRNTRRHGTNHTFSHLVYLSYVYIFMKCTELLNRWRRCPWIINAVHSEAVNATHKAPWKIIRPPGRVKLSPIGLSTYNCRRYTIYSGILSMPLYRWVSS